MNIRIGRHTFPAVKCPKCPGGALVSPPEDLERHMRERHEKACKEVTCSRCKKKFMREDRPMLAAICSACRAKLRREPNAGPGLRMSSTGIEKKKGIRAR